MATMLPSEYRAVCPLHGSLLHTPRRMPPLACTFVGLVTLSKPLDTASMLPTW